MDNKDIEHLDVLIVGAGLSGIGAAYHLQTSCPAKSYAILESRQSLGGTWDLFRYPGVRSDSDMYTLGYAFRPWRNAKTIADGPSILAYVKETAVEYGIDRKIRFGYRVQKAEWSSEQTRWTVTALQSTQDGERLVQFSCNFLYMCTGYYDYESGYTPVWPGTERYKGRLVHPQKWPSDLDYTDKQVVVIGSGATAVTLVPALTPLAAHVTMLQRSPTYIVTVPSEDALANWMKRHLPGKVAHWLTRWKLVLLGIYLYNLARRRPDTTKQTILKLIRQELGPDYDVETHFSPRYNPWDQRVCLVPDADLFRAIKNGTASVVTDEIETFTEQGLKLRSGRELKADIIVTATGLNMRFLKGMELWVDGVPVNLAQLTSYKGVMYSNVPNLASAFGYTNASWTLKAELNSEYVCRLLNYMDKHGYDQCMPRLLDKAISAEPLLNLTSGYIQRVADTLPRQGSKRPWKLYQNYLLDLVTLRFGRLNDGTMEFARSTGLKAEPLLQASHTGS